jgi:hypothetical protein
VVASAGVPRTTMFDGTIWASDSGCIAANMRQCPCFRVAPRPTSFA